ncbi:hypothetical protein F66182_4015 [Fusarium sp. NRRL 66182]|nr:hypothetical protein F66182_4015 [Fusarium sp. NRRL 66182]
MHLGLVILAALPTTWAAHIYQLRDGLAAQEGRDGCILPDNFRLSNLQAQSHDSGVTLDSIDFDFFDEETKRSTSCHKNASSKGIAGPGASRYSCDDTAVRFLWDGPSRKIWLEELVCRKDGTPPQWMVAGNTQLVFDCDKSGNCVIDSSEYKAQFSSLNEVKAGSWS